MRIRIGVWGIFLAFAMSLGNTFIFAHGGEDHGDQKPPATSNVKGTVSQTARLGDVELMIKYPELLPDTATSAKLFFTNFETNAPVDKVSPVIEIESTSGSVTAATVEKTSDTGIFNAKIPALPQGTYVVRAKITVAGKTDTATFSGIEIRPESSATSIGGFAWLRNILMTAIFLVVIALFGILIFFVFKFAANDGVEKETVSA